MEPYGKYGFRSPAELGSSDRFDMIVCQPPINFKTPKEPHADGLGGEIIKQLLPLLADDGQLHWLTARSVLSADAPAKKTLDDFQNDGFYVSAAIDLEPGALAGAALPGALITLTRKDMPRRFVGALYDQDTAAQLAAAYLSGPSKRHSGPAWAWLEPGDKQSYADLENERLLSSLTPHGRHTIVPLSSLLANGAVERAHKPIADDADNAELIYVPEFPGSRVTADLEDQTVKQHRAIYRLKIDTTKVNPRFLLQLLNSPYGKQLRTSAAHGLAIQRIGAQALLELRVPIPEMAIQDQISRIGGDLSLLRSAFNEMQGAIDKDWAAIAEVNEKVEALKSVLDIEQRIKDWWQELPYPLATVYRLYRVSTVPKERLETLLHFFEIAAIYLAAIGTSYVRALRPDYQDLFAKWLHPSGSAGIERSDFAFWISLAGASLKDTSRIVSNPDLKKAGAERAGPELAFNAGAVASLSKSAELLNVPLRLRNLQKAHGGRIKASDAARFDEELQETLRNFYEATSSVFRRVILVRPGVNKYDGISFKYEIEKLSGSDPTFETEIVELDRPIKADALAFWSAGSRSMCPAIPILRLGAPQAPKETSIYVFNRVEADGFRWVSYQEAQTQEFTASDEELNELISVES